MKISCRDLAVSFGHETALDRVNLEVANGEFLVLLGPNGAGKSTLFGVLATLVAPTAGRAMIGGFDVVREAAKLRPHLGLVMQRPALDRRLTAREHLDLHATLHHLPRPATLRVAEALDRSGLSEVADRPVVQLSGGMQRRLELARALLPKPSVLLLDEPSAGLDPHSRADLLARLRGLSPEPTVLMTTHHLDEAEAADRIAILDRGRLLACDPPDEVRSRFARPGAPLEDVLRALSKGAPDHAALT